MSETALRITRRRRSQTGGYRPRAIVPDGRPARPAAPAGGTGVADSPGPHEPGPAVAGGGGTVR